MNLTKLTQQIENVLKNHGFKFDSVELTRKGMLIVRRNLCEVADSHILNMAKAMIFKPLQRESWVLADLLNVVSPMNDTESVSYWVMTALSGVKQAVWTLYPDLENLKIVEDAIVAVLSQSQQEMVIEAANTVVESSVSFDGDMAIIETVVLPSQSVRLTVHNLVFALGAVRKVYNRGLAWFEVRDNLLVAHIVPDMNKVIHTLRLKNRLEREKLGNWGGYNRQDLVDMAVESVQNGSNLDETVSEVVSTFFTGNDPKMAAMKLRQSIVNELPQNEVSLLMIFVAISQTVKMEVL